jgi:DUF1009 family protein
VPPRLGIIAGRGDLPALIIEAAQAQGRNPFILALEGQTSPNLVAGVEHSWVRLGAVTAALDALRLANCEDIVFVGAVERPSLLKLGLDVRGTKIFAKHGIAALGDDRLLSIIIKELETEGFTVLGADDLLKELLVEEATIGRYHPDESAEIDIRRGLEAAKALGVLDVGQAVVSQQGQILGVEGVEGTDGLINRCATLQREGPGAVLVKIKKPGQERRVDLPTIGVETVRACGGAGFRGIAIEAGSTLVLHRDAVAAAADDAGLFLVAIKSRS